jgi:hypothetical protein
MRWRRFTRGNVSADFLGGKLVETGHVRQEEMMRSLLLVGLLAIAIPVLAQSDQSAEPVKAKTKL